VRPLRLGSPLALVAVVVACGGGGGGAKPTATPAPAVVRPTGPAPFEIHGMTHVSWWHDEYGYATASTSRAAFVATSGNWAGVLVSEYMEKLDSNTIGPIGDRTPETAVLRKAVEEFHAAGLKVMLKPHVDSNDGTWRGAIRPSNPAAWFESYRAFLSRWAAFAAENRIEMLCIGTELVTMTVAENAFEWNAVVDTVKAKYGGLLTYAANANTAADEFTQVPFWARLDYIGLDVYAPLTASNSPTFEALVAAWRRNSRGEDMVTAYKTVAGSRGRPVVFTEIGYRSLDGTNKAPWDWQVSAGVDATEQADCYEAMYSVWSGESSWMKGAFWWSWGVPQPTASDTGYDPWTKPAEAVLKRMQKR
jgi:hypothetical protein